ncbi:hypothetical protein KD33_04405 [Clostridium sp. NCR]|nr:hypothetical protein KD33_04405 [Clostridium sp. NCR]
MKKILFTIGMFAGGGAEKVLVNMVNSLDPNRYDITVYSVFDTGINTGLNKNIKHISTFKVKPGANDSVKQNTIKSKIKNFAFISFWRFFPMKIFYRLNIKESYDIEIAYVEGIPHKIISASSNKKSKKLAWVHIDLYTHKRARELYRNINEEKDVFEKFEKIVFVSEYSKESFKKVYGDSKKLTTRYNVNLTEEIKSRSVEKVDEIKNVKRPLFVSIGRLHDQKGYDRLLEVCNKLSKANYEFELWIIGDGALKEEFEDYINKNNLNGKVKLLGFKANPYKYLSKADWFIASSRYEGYSTVVSESLILQIPVIVTNCSGMDEITDGGKYGLIVDNTKEGILNGMKKILDNPELHQIYKERAIERSKFFNKEETLKQIETLF